jgi:hypothetical protein
VWCAWIVCLQAACVQQPGDLLAALQVLRCACQPQVQVSHPLCYLLPWCLQADSGYSDSLYRQLSAAPLVLLDGRATASSEHADFEHLQAAGMYMMVS